MFGSITALVALAATTGWLPVGSRWDTGQFPIPYCISTNAQHTSLSTAQQRQQLVNAINAWRSNAVGGGLSCTIYDAAPATYTCSPSVNLNDGKFDLFWEQNWTQGSQTLGVTHHTFQGSCGSVTDNTGMRMSLGCTFDADIEFNDANLTWDTTGENGNTDIASIATHEYGHFIGLGHCNDNNTCMFGSGIMYAAYGGGQVRVPFPDDVTGACALYPGTPGGVGFPCRANNTCTSGICVNPTASGYCSATCGTCPQGYKCGPNPQNMGQQVCVRDDGTNKGLCELCQPIPNACANGGTCLGGLPEQNAGRCATSCPTAGVDTGCLNKYTCVGLMGGGNVCIPKSSDCTNLDNFTELQFGQQCNGNPPCAAGLSCTGICTSACTGTGQGTCPMGYGCQAFQDAMMHQVLLCNPSATEGQDCSAKTCIVGPCLSNAAGGGATCYRDCAGANAGVCNNAQQCNTYGLQGGGSVSICEPPGVPPRPDAGLPPDTGVIQPGQDAGMVQPGEDSGVNPQPGQDAGMNQDAGTNPNPNPGTCACDKDFCCSEHCDCDPECNCGCDQTTACDVDPNTGANCECDPECEPGCNSRNASTSTCSCTSTHAAEGEPRLFGLLLLGTLLVLRRRRLSSSSPPVGSAQAEIAHADEALKALFVRFKEAPGSSAFEELAEALLARGHAAEALQVCEHGLMLTPTNAPGRIHRAAALLALSRPRVAYVELLRALALDPSNHRARRLLGRVFVEAGVPERAAQLLTRRAEAASAPSERVRADLNVGPPVVAKPALKPTPPPAPAPPPLAAPKLPSAPPPPPAREPPLTNPPVRDPPPIQGMPKSALNFEINAEAHGEGSPIPELFAALTSDLGLSLPDQSMTPARVEVTQVMRIRANSGREDSDELSSIEGPIVDTTQPIELDALSDAPRPAEATAPGMLLNSVSGMYALDDEPLFEDAMPFKIKGVEASENLPEDTVNDETPAALDVDALRRAMAQPPVSGLPSANDSNASAAPRVERTDPAGIDPGRTDPGQIEPSRPEPSEAPTFRPSPRDPTDPAPEPTSAKRRPILNRGPITEISRNQPPADTLLSGPPQAAGAEASLADAPDTLLGPPPGDLPYLKRFKRSSVAPSDTENPVALPALAVEAPPLKLSRVAMLIVALIVLGALVGGLGWIGREPLRAWYDPEGVQREAPARAGQVKPAPERSLVGK